MTYDQFVLKNVGKYIEYADPTNPNQCVDLMYKYMQDVWGYATPRTVIKPSLHAKNIFTNFQGYPGLVKIPNTPTGIPKRGDILFMGWLSPITGYSGHVGIVDWSDMYTFILFNQNYPKNYPCNYRRFKYKYYGWNIVRGWIHKT